MARPDNFYELQQPAFLNWLASGDTLALLPVKPRKNQPYDLRVQLIEADFIPATAAKPPELLLYGAIGSNQSWWEDRVTLGQFNRELAALGEDVPEIIVRINSPSGDVFAMEPKDIKTVDELKAAYPDLAAAIENSATEKKETA